MEFSSITKPFRRAIGWLSTRNLSFSNSFLARMGQAVWSRWTVGKAVKDGYKESGWVYRSVNLSVTSGSSVPWGVIDKNEQVLENHHLHKMLQHPNPHISRKELFGLWIAWLELCGNALNQKVVAQGETTELWPISPDRIQPKTTKDISKWLEGYCLDDERKIKWKPEEILHFKYMDPANPFWGIGPLTPAGKTVDIDVDQKKWNKAAMQNQAVLSGFISFDKDFSDQDEADEMGERLIERYTKPGNARRLGVFGSKAKYERIGATPAEMDFTQSRKDNMIEIFIIFGIPPQYAGTQESSTFNNYTTSELIFWFQKIIPILDLLKDTFNFSLRDELKDGEQITYFLTDVAAIRRAWLERSRTASNLFKMGVPFDRLNKVFKFNIEEFDGWEISYPGGKQSGGEGGGESGGGEDTRSRRSTDIETLDNPFLLNRDVAKEIEDRETWAQSWAPAIDELLSAQKRIINEAIEGSADQYGRYDSSIKVEALLHGTWESDWVPVYNNISMGYASIAANQILVEKRADDELKNALDQYLAAERIVLEELSDIESSTVSSILLQVENAIDQGLSTAMLQQAIIDAGIFEPARALRLSRTITGTAGSMGQFVSARQTGATHKKWRDSGFEVREEHQIRNAEPAVGINERFSAQFGATQGPRYPLDPEIHVADRVNCFLPGTKIQGEFLKAMRSIYHGKAVEIVTSNGNVLRVTGKHPIFSEQGLVSADHIKSGNNLLACKGNVERPVNRRIDFFASTPAHEDNGPTSVEEVFCAFSAISFTELRRGSTGDLHGDGEFVEGNIEIVGTNWPLLMDDETLATEICGELSLKCKDFTLLFKCSARTGLPSGRALTFDQVSVLLNRFPLDEFRFRSAPELDSIFHEDSIDRSSGSVKHLGKGFDALTAFIKGGNPFGISIDSFIPTMVVGGSPFDFRGTDDFIKSVMRNPGFVQDFQNRQPGNIQLDNVVSVNHFDYSGFVYDVETPYGWVIVDGIFLKQCRCSMTFEIRQ